MSRLKMFSTAGAAFGGAAAVSLQKSAGEVTHAVVSGALAFWDRRWTGHRYTVSQKQHLETYGRMCSICCKQNANLEYFEFADADGRPVKTKDDLIEHYERLENTDVPFSLCKERRELVRCIDRSHRAQVRAEEGLPIYSPETYVVSELRKCSRSFPSEPTQELTAMLDRRVRYVMEVSRYSQKHHRAICHMGELVQSMKQMLSGCRDKVMYYEWRQLLPRIHGETNSMCESMHIVLASILRSSKDVSFSCVAMSLGHAHSAPSMDDALSQLDQTFLMQSNTEEQSSSAEIHEGLCRRTHEIKDINHRMLERYLLLSDGLPLTSLSHYDIQMVRSLQECLSVLSFKMKSADSALKVLCARCDTWYNIAMPPEAVRRWKVNYEDLRDDIQEVHASVDMFSRYVNDAEAFLNKVAATSGILTSKRLASISPPRQQKKLKHE